MRIAMIGRDLPRPNASGGVSGQIDLLANTLALLGLDVTVYALNPPMARSGYHYEPIPAPQGLLKHRRAVLYLTPWWVGRIHLEGFDLVHAHGEDQFIRTDRPLVRTFYGLERAEARHALSLRHRLYHLSMVPFEAMSERRATAITAISRSTQQALGRPAQVIPCGYDPAVFHPGGAKSPNPSILFVGDLGTRKRADLLLAAFTTVVRSAVPTAELWMVTSAAVTGPGVHWLGRVSEEQLAELYRCAWVYCMPSTYEGFGMPYLEAMASGTPVVATPNGGAEEVLDDGRAGRIVPPTELGSELVRLLRSEPVRQQLIESGLARAKQYRIEKIAERYVALYEDVVKHPVHMPAQHPSA